MVEFNSKFLNKQAMSGFPRLMQIMKGRVPSIHTFGIMSVDNPMGQAAPAQFNNQQREDFKKVLQRSGYGYVQHNGKYGDFEKAFFIMNIRKIDLLAWMAKYNQHSVIYGQVDPAKNAVTFEMIGHDGAVISTREDVIGLTGDKEEYFSEYKGRKFLIPFFDDAFQPKKEDSNIPAAMPFSETQVEENEANIPHLATIYANAEHIREDALGVKVGMSNYYKRCQILQAIRSLK